MLIGHPRQKVYLAVGATDLRKAVDGLAAIVQLDFELNPFEPCHFAFCKRMRNKVKILKWSERAHSYQEYTIRFEHRNIQFMLFR